MEQFTIFFIVIAMLGGYILGYIGAVHEFNEQRQARARIRRAMREGR